MMEFLNRLCTLSMTMFAAVAYSKGDYVEAGILVILAAL